jgi:hypothetical protein
MLPKGRVQNGPSAKKNGGINARIISNILKPTEIEKHLGGIDHAKEKKR